MKTVQNTSLDLIGIGAISSGVALIQTDLKVALILIGVGFAAVILKYLTR